MAGSRSGADWNFLQRVLWLPVGEACCDRELGWRHHLHGQVHGVAKCRMMWVVDLMCPGLLLCSHRQSTHLKPGLLSEGQHESCVAEPALASASAADWPHDLRQEMRPALLPCYTKNKALFVYIGPWGQDRRQGRFNVHLEAGNAVQGMIVPMHCSADHAHHRVSGHAVPVCLSTLVD